VPVHYLSLYNAANAYIKSADVAVSTARHEFYGLSMLEASTCGAFPITPKRLSYPELFPSECMYTTERALVKKLRHFVRYVCNIFIIKNYLVYPAVSIMITNLC